MSEIFLKKGLSVKNALCVMLAFCIAFTVFIPLMNAVISADDTEPKPTYMLHVQSKVNKEIYHSANLGEGEYVFEVSTTVMAFEPLLSPVGDWRNNKPDNIELLSKETHNGYTTYKYKYNVSLDFLSVSPWVYIGIGLIGSGNVDGYLFNAKFYKADDENKTDCFNNGNGDFANGFLDDWAWGWDVEFNGDKNSRGLSEWKNSSTTLKVVTYDESLFDNTPITPIEPETPNNMLHIKSGVNKEFYHSANLAAGDYYFSFSANNLKFEPLLSPAGMNRANQAANIELVSSEKKNNYVNYLYKYSVTEDILKDSTWVYMGIGLNGSEGVDGYFFAATFYRADDENKTDCFNNGNGDFANGFLDDWAWGWDVEFNGDKNRRGLSEWKNSSTTLKVVTYDESLFDNTPITPIEPETPNNMLHIKSGVNKEFYHSANLAAGDYYFSFSANNLKFEPLLSPAGMNRANQAANIELVSSEKKNNYVNYLYKYSVTEDILKDSTWVYMGIGLNGSEGVDGYFFAATFYRADDENKTDCFNNGNGDFANGFLDDWAWGWDVEFNGSKNPKALSKWEDKDTLFEVLKYDESVFKKINDDDMPNTEPKMLYINTKENYKELYQRVNVNKGQQYCFNFGITKGASFMPICVTDGSRVTVQVSFKLSRVEDKGKYNEYHYTLEVPQVDVQNNPVGDKVFIGMAFDDEFEGYFFNSSLYAVNDEKKTELFENPDFMTGAIDSWAWGWDAWFGFNTDKGLKEWNNKKTILRVVKYDESLFKLPIIDNSKKMIYFSNGATATQFASRVTLEPSGEYYMVFSGYTTGNFNIAVTENGLRATVQAKNELVSVKSNGNYNIYTYKFTMPADLKDYLVFVGPQVSFFSEGYIFDMLLYSAKDATKTNLWKNSDFKKGLDGWIWGWSEWFGVLSETKQTRWTKGLNTVNIEELDLKLIDKLIAELNINDGKWWKDSDIITDSYGYATVKGRLFNENKEGIADIKLTLESDIKEYDAVTDSDGNFNFNSVLEGYYELFAFNTTGEKLQTGYFANLYKGDDVTLSLLCDNSKISAVGIGSLEGTVYSADLKTISNLKIYLRGVGEAVTDKNGHFEFSDLKSGDYDIYTLLDDGSEYILKTVAVKENIHLSTKLKYDPDVKKVKGFTTVLIVSVIGAAILVSGGVAVLIAIKKKRKTNR